MGCSKTRHTGLHLAPGRWKNCITKAWSTPETQVDTDHFLLRATLRCKLAARSKESNKRETYFPPNTEQKAKYNETISALQRHTAGEMIEAITTASELHFTKKDPEIRQPYITETTWELIKQKREARERGDYTTELALRKSETIGQKRQTQTRRTTIY